MKILIYGLPGAGKTHLAKRLVKSLGAGWCHVNADEVREAAGDWDFTREGRIRQARRLRDAADRVEGHGKHAVIDAVAALAEQRQILDPDFSVLLWTMDRADCRYDDTAGAFELPGDDEPVHKWYTHRYEYDQERGYLDLLRSIQEILPHGLMVGRFQPWHAGHRALFDKLGEKYGYVTIGVRTVGGRKNPYNFDTVRDAIFDDLTRDYTMTPYGFNVVQLPNITGIHWGRDVGYATGRIELPPDIEAISATQIRKGRKS